MIKKYYSLIIFISLEIFLIFLYHSFSFLQNSASLSVITALFLFGLPSSYYLLIRKKRTDITFWLLFYSAFKTTPFAFTMEDNFFEPVFRYKILFNILFLLYLTFKTREFIIDFRKNLNQKRAEENDDHSLISSALEELIKFKRLGKMIAFEACSFYYCFFKWKKNNNEKKYFTGYQNNGITALYLGVMFVSIAEAVTLHYLLISWNRIFAITFLTLHIYLLINLTGHLKAIFFRNHFISDEEIIIRYGLFNTLKIPIDLIEKINKFEGDYEKNNSLVKFALLGKLEPHNVSLELKDKLEIDLPFGIKKSPINILLYIDNEMEFLKIVNSKIQ